MLRIGKVIESVDDWFEVAPPKKGLKHWVDGRSAKELAKAWFPSSGSPQLPPEFDALLQSRPETQGIEAERGEPERVTRFDGFRGEGRNADLVLWGHGPNVGKVLVSVEAKADEAFGEVAGEYANDTIAKKPRSNVPDRLELLCQGIFGTSRNATLDALRYQLFTGVAGALAEGSTDGYRADAVLFVVHEFTSVVDPVKQKQNADDLDAFVDALPGGQTPKVTPGQLVGPFSVPGNQHFAGTDALFIGKCQR